ncbi:MAG: PA0069 family radical SAM protein [Hyphomonadaceae bacterium]|nr:PA0069 family radical SAM protein [Hyphomonadaceae bacterium]
MRPSQHGGVFKGRGAVSNASGRFEREARTAFDDGWDPTEAPAPLATVVTRETARTIISRNDSPDLSFDRTINTYRGCEHGCIYCYARPNHAYAGLSPGLDFERLLFAKENAAALLAKELAAPGYAPATLVMGGVTDVYQPIERTYAITRAVLEVLAAHQHPVAIITKSALVLRDLDILAPMAARGLARVAISVTTLDRALARRLEPRAATPARRLETLRGLADAGVPAVIMTAPVIPGLTDHELERLLEAGAAAGATGAGYVLLRLPLEIADLFAEWLDTHAPDRAARVMNTMRAMRGGATYDSRWRVRQTGQGPFAAMLAARFRRACARLGLNRERTPLDASQFRRPPRPGEQLTLW